MVARNMQGLPQLVLVDFRLAGSMRMVPLRWGINAGETFLRHSSWTQPMSRAIVNDFSRPADTTLRCTPRRVYLQHFASREFRRGILQHFATILHATCRVCYMYRQAWRGRSCWFATLKPARSLSDGKRPKLGSRQAGAEGTELVQISDRFFVLDHLGGKQQVVFAVLLSIAINIPARAP